jgi:hypothetical protein
MDRRSSHRIWLKDITPYVFCGTYKKKHQMRKHGEFEIYFTDKYGLLSSSSPVPFAFHDIFRPFFKLSNANLGTIAK